MAEVPPRQQVNGTDAVQMNAADGLPHYNDPNATTPGPGYAPADGAFVALRSQNGAGDALAILKAFQEYMDAEKQRAQRRTAVVAYSLAALLALVIAGFFMMWFSTVRGLQNTQTALISATLEKQQAAPAVDVNAAIAAAVEKVRAEQAAALAEAEKARLEQAAAAAKAQAAAAEKAAQDKAAADKAAMDAVTAARAEQDAAFAKVLEKMNATLEAVKKDNESLRAAVRDAAAEKLAAKPAAPAATAKPASPPADKPQPPAPPVKPGQPATAPQTVPAPAAPAQPASQVHSTTTEPQVAEQPAASPPAAVQPTQYAEVRTIAPEIKIKRPAPPKGFTSDTLPIPLGKDGAKQVNWSVLLPNEVR